MGGNTRFPRPIAALLQRFPSLLKKIFSSLSPVLPGLFPCPPLCPA